MINSLRWAFLPGVLLLSLTGLVSAAGETAGVHDTAGYFSQAAVRQADDEITALQKQFQVDLLIDTVASVPPDKVNQVKAMKPAERNEFFLTWARERARAAKIRGVYVLICKTPSHLQVEVGNETQKKAFTLEDRSKLRDLLLARFKASEYDKGLLEAVKFFRGRLENNLPAPLPPVALNEVKDNAAFFSPDTVQKANAEIRELKQSFGQDVVVETIKELPADKAKLIQNATAATREKVFAEWVAERANASGVKGIYILICRNPSHLQIDVTKALRDKNFPVAEMNRLRELLVARFKNKEYDKGLLEGLALIRETFEKNLSPTQNMVAVREVKDYARYFSAIAVQKANADLRALPRGPGKDVAIETFPTPPPDQVQRVEKMSATDREKYYKGWAEERAKQAKLDGVLILITKQPRHLLVDRHGTTARKLYSDAEINQLTKVLLDRFRANEYDQGLFDAVRILREKLAPESVAPPVASLPPPVVGQVKDHGKFFSQDAVDKADAIIRDIKERYKVPVQVETFISIAPGKEKQMEEMLLPERYRFYTDLMKERRKLLGGMDGIQVVASKQPSHLQIEVGPETLKKAFTAGNINQLYRVMSPRFQSNRFDDGLIQGMTLIRSLLQSNLGTTSATVPPPDPVKTPDPSVKSSTTPPDPSKDKMTQVPTAKTSPESSVAPTAKKEESILATAKEKAKEAGQSKFPTWMWVVGIVVGLLVLWIFIGILRALFGGSQRPRYAETPPQRPMPMAETNPPPQGYGGGYSRGPQSGGYQGTASGMPPAPIPPGGAGGGGGGGGHNFLYGVLGGMFGAAAGNWAYDSFLRKTVSPGMGGMPTSPIPPVSPSRPAAPLPVSSPSSAPSDAGYSAGGDFGTDDNTTGTGSYSTGGDFGSPDTQTAGAASGGYSAGGDFGDSSAARGDASGGGDFGSPSGDESASAGGGDFDSPGSGGYDTASADSGGGGDFGGGDASGGDDAGNSGGGDFGSDSGGGGDFGGSDSGGDSGGSDSGGDTGGGGDTSGGSEGGDF